MTNAVPSTPQAFADLFEHCRANNFAGWDPYDGLNSKVFKAIPLVGRSAICRLVWIQGFKRFPFNLRPLFMVPKQKNAKGIALALGAVVNMVKYLRQHPDMADVVGTEALYISHVRQLADDLVAMRCPDLPPHASGWGYNFPWQCRREFLFPAGEPTVVATFFAVKALLDAFELTGNTSYRDVALDASHFVAEHLRRTPHKGGIILSYSRMPGNDTIYNASLLGSAILAMCNHYRPNPQHLQLAKQSVEACVADQRPDGSWTYGVKPVTGWVDSFHTGYNLMALHIYRTTTGDTSVNDAIDKGLDYYLSTFFLPDGTPKYYHNKTYPIDIHCPGQLFVTLHILGVASKNSELSDKVYDWTIRNMRHCTLGYFFYQLKQGKSSKIPYMRWSNAFMLNALSCRLLDIEN